MTGNRTDTTLPIGWAWTTLDGIVEILDRQRVPINSKERAKRIEGKPTDHLYPYYGATGQVGWIDDYLFDEELVLLGEDGAPFLDFGKDVAYLIRGKSWVNNHAHVLHARPDKLNNRFLLHYLNLFDFHGYVTGTTRLKLNQGVMRDIPIALAPLAEQRRIVEAIEALFTQLDAGVVALKRAQRQVQRYKASVLKAACEGRLVPQDPADEPAADLLRRILAERRAAWKGKGKYQEPAGPDTEGLPELPEGWVWATLEQTAWDSRYGTSQKCDYAASGPPVLRIPNIVSGKFNLVDLKFGTKPAELNTLDPLAPNDLLIIRTNGSPDLIGRSALVSNRFDQPTYFASYLIRFRIIGLDGFGNWVSAIWDSPLIREWLEQRAATSAGQYNISIGTLNHLPIPLPPLAEQQHIVEEVERRLSVASALEQTIAANLKRAEQLRQAILKRAFAGHLVPQDPHDEPASPH